MAPQDETPDEGEEKMEHNYYRDTLVSSKSTVRTCGENVYSGLGSPLEAIANPIADGGWVCTEAETWTTEMTGQCSGIVEAFEDAVSHVQSRIGDEPGEVPENTWRGLAWPRSWAYRRNY